ncbi:sulfotransferase family protein [Mycobacterium paraffinicum]|uniref:Sulfotransferase family protein n=1 Tax=Mycobacterium paraffinicum TaxID=53378 RepID=A0ABP8RCW3_9MYCO|nr:sulfotransferase family protein [Mycobacterium paraffinicum]MCV7313726.1 sulfotransferase family protein [Mycobacterium paraffinicum]
MEIARSAQPAESVATAGDAVHKGAASGSETRPVVLFVLGTQRSGTSAITRVLSLCGGTLPAGMLGADAGNPRGNWEPRKAIVLNEAILHRNGSAWFDPSLRLQEDEAMTAEQKTACIAEISSYLKTMPAAPLVVIKDPRITILSDLWFESSCLAGRDVAAVIAVRHPHEVISSVAASWKISPELSSALWLKYNLLAERHTRGIPRVFVEYTSLLEDWRREIKRISTALSIDLNTLEQDAIDEFLTPDLRRQRNRGSVTNRFGTDWISAVYDAECMAARDECPDEAMLDRIFESYRASERDFRSAVEDYRKLSGGVRSRIFRPSVMKPLMELGAMAHRRKGTWA